MKLFIRKEIVKRAKAKTITNEAQKNWKVRKPEIEELFRKYFSEFKVDNIEIHIDNNLDDDFSEKQYVGYDCLQATYPMRFTGNRIITIKEGRTTYDVKKEIGAVLVITTSAIGSFDIFLDPARNDDKLTESKGLLIYSCKDPKKLTDERIRKSIMQFLIFQRVDSIMEFSSLYERVYIKWLYFWDVRNREKYSSLLFQVTNHWGAVAISALAAWVIAKST
jgi:hypothetical protein